MNGQGFDKHMNRLIVQFGKTAYSAERSALIWQTVNQLSEASWARIVNKLIGECRQPPLLPEIREAAAFERERSWASDKNQHARDAHEFMTGRVFGDDARREISQTIIARLKGQVNDESWAAFIDGINALSGGKTA